MSRSRAECQAENGSSVKVTVLHLSPSFQLSRLLPFILWHEDHFLIWGREWVGISLISFAFSLFVSKMSHLTPSLDTNVSRWPQASLLSSSKWKMWVSALSIATWSIPLGASCALMLTEFPGFKLPWGFVSAEQDPYCLLEGEWVNQNTKSFPESSGSRPSHGQSESKL